MTVYIMTRSRLGNLPRIIPAWREQGIPVNLVVERSEYIDHLSLVNRNNWSGVEVLPLRLENRGFGYACRSAVEHASKHRHESIIMSDDDLLPKTGSDFHPLLEEAAKDGVLGVGATRPIHDHFTKGATARLHGVILCPGGWGQQLYALNVPMAMELGNFDPRLTCFGEGHEMIRQGISHGIPWLVHCDVKAKPIGARYAPGGLSSLYPGNERAEEEIKCRRIIHDRWPQYTSEPEARPRVAWAKMLNDYIPGWKHLSAMHGGQWEE